VGNNIAPKLTNEPKVHYFPEPAWDKLKLNTLLS